MVNRSQPSTSGSIFKFPWHDGDIGTQKLAMTSKMGAKILRNLQGLHHIPSPVHNYTKVAESSQMGLFLENNGRVLCLNISSLALFRGVT
jgi:hypothetical protein